MILDIFSPKNYEIKFYRDKFLFYSFRFRLFQVLLCSYNVIFMQLIFPISVSEKQDWWPAWFPYPVEFSEIPRRQGGNSKV